MLLSYISNDIIYVSKMIKLFNLSTIITISCMLFIRYKLSISKYINWDIKNDSDEDNI